MLLAEPTYNRTRRTALAWRARKLSQNARTTLAPFFLPRACGSPGGEPDDAPEAPSASCRAHTRTFAASLGVLRRHRDVQEEEEMDGRAGGIGLGGILVIVGIVLAILLGHWWIGLIIALVGLVFFGGFAKGKWY